VRKVSPAEILADPDAETSEDAKENEGESA